MADSRGQKRKYVLFKKDDGGPKICAFFQSAVRIATPTQNLLVFYPDRRKDVETVALAHLHTPKSVRLQRLLT